MKLRLDESESVNQANEFLIKEDSSLIESISKKLQDLENEREIMLKQSMQEIAAAATTAATIAHTALLRRHSMQTTDALLRRQLIQVSLLGQGRLGVSERLVTGEEITPLNEDDSPEVHPQQQQHAGPPLSSLVQQQQSNQRANWIIRHSGSKHLSRVLFKRDGDIVPFADIIVSLKDDIGTTYTSYVHVAAPRYRATTMHKVLQRAGCVTFFRIYDVTKPMMQKNFPHFNKIAEGVKSVHKNLIIEMADPSIHFDFVMNTFFIK